MTQFVRLDADYVGDKIELALLNGDTATAQQIHDSIQLGMQSILRKIETSPGWRILMSGCDDILFEVSNKDGLSNDLESLRLEFFNLTGHSISMGVGSSIHEAILNLTKAKLMGRNRTVGLS